jgi:hypothetical protein
MGQTVYVLMVTEGGKKSKEWRPVAVVTDPDKAEEWYNQYGSSGAVDWVPLGLDEVQDINPEHQPQFMPRKMTPTEERTAELAKQTEATIKRMQGIIDQQNRQLEKQQRLLERFQKSRGIKASLLKQAAVPPKPVGFEDALNDAQEIADYIETYANYEVDNEFVYEKFRGCHAVLKLVPLDQLQEGGRDNNERSQKNEDKYLKQNLKTQPPAVVENGKVLDGNHRFRANKRRGLTAMWCYVVMEGSHASDIDGSSDQES